jgi:hypothetical protein
MTLGFRRYTSTSTSKETSTVKTGRKYPELIEYYQKKGYNVTSDTDLKNDHAWIPIELYVRFIAKTLGRFDGERGKVSKAFSEALEQWTQTVPREEIECPLSIDNQYSVLSRVKLKYISL